MTPKTKEILIELIDKEIKLNHNWWQDKNRKELLTAKKELK